MASCASRDNSAAVPESPKPALLTTISGSRFATKAAADLRDRIVLFEVDRQHRSAAAFPSLRSHRPAHQADPPPRHQNELMTVRGKHPRQFRADAGRRAGDQRDRLHSFSLSLRR